MIGRLSFRGRFTLTAIAALIGAAIIGWSAMDIIAEALRPLVELGLRLLGLAESATIDNTGSWIIRSTQRTLDEGRAFDITLGRDIHIYILRSLPIFVALMLAPPYDRSLTWRIPAGLLALLGVAALSVIAIVNGYVVVAINHASPVEGIPVPPFRLDAAPLPELWSTVSFLFYYGALMVLPLIAPVAIWALLKPQALRRLIRPDADQR